MAPYSEKSKRWREENHKFILEWRRKIDDLRNLGNLENWTHERLEIEIAQLLDSDLRKIWDFANMCTSHYRTSKLSEYFGRALAEIRDYGTIELSRKNKLLKSIERTRRKMYGR